MALHKLAFICSANMCRSPMAHAILAAEAQRRGLPINVFSAGTWNFEGDMAAIDARLTCERHKTPMPKLLSTPLRKLDLSNATRVFCDGARTSQKSSLPLDCRLNASLCWALSTPSKASEEIADRLQWDQQPLRRVTHESAMHLATLTRNYADLK